MTDKLPADDCDENLNELRKLIQVGIDSGPGIPADQLFEELRRVAKSLDSRN